MYENPWMTVWHDEVIRPDTSGGIYGVVHFSTSGVWVAATRGDEVLLVGQHRYPLEGEWSWELPAGRLELDEAPLDGAKRELAEETGVRSRTWRELFRSALAPGVSDLQAICFHASDLTVGTPSPEGGEDLVPRWVTLAQAVDMVQTGEILDAATQTAVYRLRLETVGAAS